MIVEAYIDIVYFTLPTNYTRIKFLDALRMRLWHIRMYQHGSILDKV